MLREELVAISHRAYERGLVFGISGNNSVRVPYSDNVLIKTTGCNQGDMDTSDTVLVDLDGNVLEEGKRPSKEIRWHLAIYRKNPEVGGDEVTFEVTDTGTGIAPERLERLYRVDKSRSRGKACGGSGVGADDFEGTGRGEGREDLG